MYLVTQGKEYVEQRRIKIPNVRKKAASCTCQKNRDKREQRGLARDNVGLIHADG
jgi:hypothetical protein